MGLCLGVHKNIVSTYDVAFETSGFYVFTQASCNAQKVYGELHKLTNSLCPCRNTHLWVCG